HTNMSETITRYLVVDLEATCDDHHALPREDSEIIEIGAVLVDGATLEPQGEFQSFVRPVVHPRLTPFCTQLTTITQADVVRAPTRGVIDRFEALIAPISDEVITSRDSFARARVSGAAPAEAMRRFAEWTLPHRERRATFIARPAAFDWPWIVWYAWTFLGENPFGFKAVCASSWFQSRGKRFEVELPHVAADDAEIQIRHFFAEA